MKLKKKKKKKTKNPNFHFFSLTEYALKGFANHVIHFARASPCTGTKNSWLIIYITRLYNYRIVQTIICRLRFHLRPRPLEFQYRIRVCHQTHPLLPSHASPQWQHRTIEESFLPLSSSRWRTASPGTDSEVCPFAKHFRKYC